jgi:mannose-6-phosphate isomerase-like protein (cupin superfamily)
MEDTFTGFDGSEFTVLRRPTNPRDSLEMRFRFVPDCAAPPPHVHPDTHETFAVEEGEFELLRGSEWQRVTAGESVVVEPGTRHTFRNRSGAPVVVHNVHDPHHDFERYLRSLTGLSHELRATAPNSPKAALRFAKLWAEHPDLIRPADLPMRLGMPVLTALGRVARV